MVRFAKETVQGTHDLPCQSHKRGERPCLPLYRNVLYPVHALCYMLPHEYTTDFLPSSLTQYSCQFLLDEERENDLHACPSVSCAFSACPIRHAKKLVVSASSATSPSCLTIASRRWAVAMGIVEKGASKTQACSSPIRYIE